MKPDEQNQTEGLKPLPEAQGSACGWKIEYDNDTGPNDEGFTEWWIVTDGTRCFKCNSEDDAIWLTEQLNA